MIYDIIQNPHPALRRAATPVTDFNDPDLPVLIQNMKETMLKNDGWGLAAPQIDKSISLFVILDDVAPEGHTVFINPKILSVSKDQETEEEGCLSFLGKMTDMRRPLEVTISAQDEHGKKFRATGKGLLARVFIHETDHLKGTLFIDHIHEL